MMEKSRSGMISKAAFTTAVLTMAMCGGPFNSWAQNLVTGCLKPKGKIVRADDTDTPTKPCKNNQTEITLVGADHVLIEEENTAIGVGAFISNTTGMRNTAYGINALKDNTEGGENTAVGAESLTNNTTGNFNTAVGDDALLSNTTGSFNTAVGEDALASNTSGDVNVAIGKLALENNTTGSRNVAVGGDALEDNTTGNFNTAVGEDALRLNQSGSNNTALGVEAGHDLLTGSDNIYINNVGADESATIRIGTEGTQTRAFIAGINTVDVGGGGTAVFINAAGQLGTIASSRRFKKDIQDIDDASTDLMKLRPVMFRYKSRGEGSTPLEYGLIAEEVAKVYPDLVVRAKTGEVQTVQYHKVNAMLLNEVQKQHRQIQEQQKLIANLSARLVVLEAKSSQ